MVLSKAKKSHHLTYISKSAASILRAADEGNPKIKKALLDALNALKAQVPDLTSLIATGNPSVVMDAVRTAQVPQPLLDRIIDATVTTAVAGGMSDAAKFSVAFNDVNDRAVRWATLNAAKDITSGGVGLATQAAIRDVMVNATEAGVNPRVTAKLIEGMVPLDGHRAGQIQRFTDKAIEDGLDPDHIAKVVARKTAKGIKARAVTIARTESLKAANRGQQLVWDSAKDLGYIPAGTMKVWDATGDSRTCPICRVMDGTPVEVSSNFTVNQQATGFSSIGEVLGTKPIKKPSSPKTPPAHPQCRCTMVLENIPAGRAKQPATTGGQPEPSPFASKLTDRDKYGASMTDAQAAQLDDAARWVDDNVPDDVKDTLDEVMGNTNSIHPLREVAEAGSDTKGVYIMADETERRSLNLRFNEIPDEDQRAWNKLWNDTYSAERQRLLAEGVPDRDIYQTMRPWADDWKAAHPEPSTWVPRPTEKIGSTIVHELGHGLDISRGYISKSDKFTNMHTSITRLYESGTNPEMWYAASKPSEMFAELFKFYSIGDGTLTAEAWRAANPRWAQTMKELLA